MRRTQFGLREILSTKVRVTTYGALLLCTALFSAPAAFADFDADAEATADASLRQISESTPASDESVRDALRSVFKETAPERVKDKDVSAPGKPQTKSTVVKQPAEPKEIPVKEVSEKEVSEKEAPAKEASTNGAPLKETVAKSTKSEGSKTAGKPTTSSAHHKLACTGVADYYADMFHGRKTASGQIHDKTKMTAAHLSLPFGTKLKVVSRHTGKSCVVTVNDRGPYTKNKIIDLSFAAAKELGLVTAGSRLVDCYLIEPE